MNLHPECYNFQPTLLILPGDFDVQKKEEKNQSKGVRTRMF